MAEKHSITYKCCETDKMITTTKKYTKLPYKLEDITIGSTDVEVENPYSGAKYTLDPIEEAVYSCIKGAEILAYSNVQMISLKEDGVKNMSEKMWDTVNVGADWFRTNNPEAYMTLLD